MLLLCYVYIWCTTPQHIYSALGRDKFPRLWRHTPIHHRIIALFALDFHFFLVSASSFLLLVYCTLPHQLALWMQSTSIRVCATCVNIFWQRRHIIPLYAVGKLVEKTFWGAHSLTFMQHTTPHYWSINNDIDFWFHLLITFDWLLLCVYRMCEYMRFIEKGGLTGCAFHWMLCDVVRGNCIRNTYLSNAHVEHHKQY